MKKYFSTFALFLLVSLFSSSAMAQSIALAKAGNYFPSQKGNTWTYEWKIPTPVVTYPPKPAQMATQTTDIPQVSGNRSYYSQHVYSARWIYSVPGQNRVYVYQNGSYSLLYDFTSTAQYWKINLTNVQGATLVGTITVGSRNETVVTPAGTFKNCIRLDWSASHTGVNYIVAPNDIISQWFAPNVGLVRWTEKCYIQGTSVLDICLKSAKVNGVKYPVSTFSGLQASLALDSFSYDSATGNIEAEFLLKNGTSQDIPLTFRSTQRYDMVIYDAQGMAVWTWSSNKKFGKAMAFITVASGNQLSFKDTISLGSGFPSLAPGNYSIHFFLTSDQKFSGTCSFQVQ